MKKSNEKKAEKKSEISIHSCYDILKHANKLRAEVERKVTIMRDRIERQTKNIKHQEQVLRNYKRVERRLTALLKKH